MAYSTFLDHRLDGVYGAWGGGRGRRVGNKDTAIVWGLGIREYLGALKVLQLISIADT